MNLKKPWVTAIPPVENETRAVEWETVSRTELSQLRRENAALRAHVDRLEIEAEQNFPPMKLWARILSTFISLVLAAALFWTAGALLIWTASRVFR